MPGLMALLLLAAMPARADESIRVLSASAEVQGDVVRFTARSQYPIDDQMREALAAGAIVDIDLKATLDRRNRIFPDESIAEGNLRRELSWNSPTQRYVLKEIKPVDDGQRTFATLEEAMAAAGVVDALNLTLDEPLEPGATYEAAVRARLRRGRVPSALRALTFWTRYWGRSERYSWVLPH
jgi:hypothetical protein